MRKSIFIFLTIIGSIVVSSCNRADNEKEFVKKVELNRETIAVGIYKATGYEHHNINYVTEALKIDGGIVFVSLSDADVLKTRLENIDVIIFPEIENAQYIDKLDDELAEIFNKFISKKGAIALCNGCSLLLKSQDCQTLNIVELNLNSLKDSTSLLSRTGFVLNEEGEKIFPELKDYENLFVDNCTLNKMEADTANGNEILGFVSNSELNEPLFITAKYNSGKIFITNTHPETTPGMRWILPRIVRWVYNQEFIFYNKKVFRPDYYSRELILDSENKEEIEKLILQLDNGKKDEKIAAMDKLQKICPYDVADKVRFLLKEKNNDLKLRAAKFLVDIEYTSVIDELKKIIKSERSKKVKEQLNLYLYDLESMIEQN